MKSSVCILLLCLVGFSNCQDGQDIDALISSVFPEASSQKSENQEEVPGPGTGGGFTPEQPPSQPDPGPEPEPNQGSDLPPPGECECVPYYLCDNGTLITDGKGLIDIRLKGECDNYMDVCCNAPLKEPIAPPPKQHLSCGMRNPEGVGFRITGNEDNEAQYGEIPWMVAILKEDNLQGGMKLHIYQCGGALIHKHVVLTAAHCVHKKEPDLLKVRAGEWDTKTKSELYPHQDRDVVQIIVHEKYYAGALYNDVALLITKEPFEYADNVDIICLPQQNDVVLSPHCLASGWGKDNFGQEGNYQVILKRIELPMVPRDKCMKALRNTRLGPHFRLHESFVCAGGVPGKDTCKGDGGGPLVCPIPNQPNRYQQVGIVAWGIGCGEETPAVYVNVAHFRNWIDSHMKKLKYDTGYKY